MKKMGIQDRIKRRYITTTDSRHNNKIHPNLASKSSKIPE